MFVINRHLRSHLNRDFTHHSLLCVLCASVVILLLAACQPAAMPQELPTLAVLPTDLPTETATEEFTVTPTLTETPAPTATFTPVLVDTFFHPGDVFAVTSNVVLKPGRLYRICFSGIVNLTTGPARPSDIDHANGIAVPSSGCLVLEGNGQTVAVTCGTGEPAQDPGGFTIQVFDLGPS